MEQYNPKKVTLWGKVDHGSGDDSPSPVADGLFSGGGSPA